MEKLFAFACLINHMIACMVWRIKNNPAGRDGFAKYTSCCRLIFVDKEAYHEIHENLNATKFSMHMVGWSCIQQKLCMHLQIQIW